MDLRRIALTVGLVLLLSAVACRTKHPHRAIYRFENVRESPVDEWPRIRRALEEHVGGEIDERPANRREFAGKQLVDYEIAFPVADLKTLVKIQKSLDSAFGDKYGPNGMDFPLVSTELTYRSNFIAVGAEIVVRGITAPGATVHLRLGQQAYRVRSGNDGSWSQVLAVAPNRPFLYGYSEDRGGAKRFFRLNLLSMREEAISKKTFESVYPPVKE